MKPVLFLQAFGLGDVIWSQSIAQQQFIQKGQEVIWPVKPHYVDACQRAYSDICFISDELIKPEIFNIKEKDVVGGAIIAPIRWSDSYMKLPYKEVMKAKYLMYDMDWRSWRNHATWLRDSDKEKELFKMFSIKKGEKFNLINKRFGANAERLVEINVNNGYRNIELIEIPGFSLFDWTLVILSASEIHTVSTSLVYMLEMLPLSAPIHLYCRKPIEQNFSFIDFFFTKKYILHQ